MKKFEFNPESYIETLRPLCLELSKIESISEKSVEKLQKKYTKSRDKIFGRDEIIAGIKFLGKKGELVEDVSEKLIEKIKLKPTRSISGVTTVTVLTKPFACPGRCIFCPNDIRMPKSYITTEPGAQRALMNRFSPYLQVFNRLLALSNIGHPTSKIELLILGGTWSYYPINYKIWFIKECFRAMNDFGDGFSKQLEDDYTIDITNDLKNDLNDQIRQKVGNKPYNQLIQSDEYKKLFSKNIQDKSPENTKEELWILLSKEQNRNVLNKTKCVGLVLETRPDCINVDEVLHMRKLGATKVQIGFQTLDDEISKLNKRGEKREHVVEAFKLLRAGGFKIHGHYMPNLFGSTVQKDLEVYKELFDSPLFRPDELKIYPTSVIKNTELFDKFNSGEYKPYETKELVDLIADCIEYTPEYCRLTRIIRDIPSTEIEGGNKTTNLREVVEYKLKKESRRNRNIRNREVRDEKIDPRNLKLDVFEYDTSVTREFFLQFITNEHKIAGFLRLSLPNTSQSLISVDLNGCAMIREVHIYGPSIEVEEVSDGFAQHLGLGSKLIEESKKISKKYNFSKLAVISAIGTRDYYKKREFSDEYPWMIATI